MLHVLYNLYSMSLEKSLRCVLILKLGQHGLCLPNTLIRQIRCVYTVLMFRGSKHGTVFLYLVSSGSWCQVLVSLKYKLNPIRGLCTQKEERYNTYIYGPIKAVTLG